MIALLSPGILPKSKPTEKSRANHVFILTNYTCDLQIEINYSFI